MAKGRPSKYDWGDIEKHYKAGMSQTEIVKKFQCPKSSLSERIKKEKWEQSEQAKSYISDSIAINEQKANLIEQDERVVEIADNIIDEQTRRRGLLFNGVEKAVKKMNDIIEHGLVEEKINIGDGMQKFEERKINTSDVKNALDGYDKASLTLGVNQRHSNQQINVNTQNNNSLQHTELNKQIVEDTLQAFDDEY